MDLRANDIAKGNLLKDKLTQRLVENNHVPYAEGEEEDLIKFIFSMMLYQAGSFKVCGLCQKTRINLQRRGPEHAVTLFERCERTIYVTSVVLMINSAVQSALVIAAVTFQSQSQTQLSLIQISLILQYC